jgi:hypothetical protein
MAAHAAGIAFSAMPAAAQPVVWMEAESFADTGRWSNDSQHVDLMGSPYLLATGVGKPVGGEWKTVAKSAQDRSRRIVLRFDPVTTGIVRLVADSDQPPMALCEARLYAAP